MRSKQLLICDLDNTLYDWVGFFVPSFYAMVDAAIEVTGCDRDKLLEDFRTVHQKYGDSEHPFALLETETMRQLYRGASSGAVLAALNPAFHAFNSSRKRTLHLHRGVSETLGLLRAHGVRLIAHTESKLYSVIDRLNRLDLFKYFDKIYCRQRSTSPHPDPHVGSEWLARFPTEKIIELSRHQAKPNPAVLLEICESEETAPENAAYVGDSIARDILMAKRANVFAIWASYGAYRDAHMYQALVRISHWTADEVAREKILNEEAKNVAPDYILRDSFEEILAAINIGQAEHPPAQSAHA